MSFASLRQVVLGLAVFGWCAAVGPARADESIADVFRAFMVDGCIPSFDPGIPVASYAQGLGLVPANSNLAAAFLRGRPGVAYIKVTPETVLIIAETADSCTVATRIAQDLPGLTQSVEVVLATLKTPFVLVKEEQRPLVAGGITVVREYEGAIGGRPFGVMLSTTATGFPQATVTIYRKVR